MKQSQADAPQDLRESGRKAAFFILPPATGRQLQRKKQLPHALLTYTRGYPCDQCQYQICCRDNELAYQQFCY